MRINNILCEGDKTMGTTIFGLIGVLMYVAISMAERIG